MVDWKDASTALSISSVVLAGIGAGLPDYYGKIILAVSVGLANGAVLAFKHGSSENAAPTR